MNTTQHITARATTTTTKSSGKSGSELLLYLGVSLGVGLAASLVLITIVLLLTQPARADAILWDHHPQSQIETRSGNLLVRNNSSFTLHTAPTAHSVALSSDLPHGHMHERNFGAPPQTAMSAQMNLLIGFALFLTGSLVLTALHWREGVRRVKSALQP